MGVVYKAEDTKPRDGKQLLLAKGSESSDVIQMSNFRQ